MDGMISAENPESIKKTEEILSAGAVAVLPTDTVYGIMALASSPKGRQSLCALKPRSAGFSYSFLISQPQDIYGLGLEISPGTEELINKYWPGGLMLVLKRISPSSKLGAAEPEFGETTAGIRCPAHSWLQNLISNTGILASSSANLHKQPSPANIKDLPQEIKNSAGIIVDGGELCGTASTVLDMTGENPRVLRQGALKVNLED